MTGQVGSEMSRSSEKFCTVEVQEFRDRGRSQGLAIRRLTGIVYNRQHFFQITWLKIQAVHWQGCTGGARMGGHNS